MNSSKTSTSRPANKASVNSDVFKSKKGVQDTTVLRLKVGETKEEAVKRLSEDWEIPSDVKVNEKERILYIN